MKLSDLAVLDYETEKIEDRPDYPPKPVGCAVILPGKQPRYYAWGHPTENNCSKADFKRVLKSIVKSYRCLYHNGKFDIQVSEEHFGVPRPNFWEWEDSMFLAYLVHPRSRQLKLKQLADLHLDMPPDEQDKLRDWIINNVKGTRESNWGEFIAQAPGKLVGRYAVGDVVRTLKLYKKFYPYVVESEMLEAYNVEKQIMPITIDMESRGVPLDVDKLRNDLNNAKRNQKLAQNRIFKRLGTEFNINSPKQKIEVFESAGVVDEWIYNTDAQGNYTSPKTGIEELMVVCNDKKLVKDLEIFSKLNKVISTYMEPWLASSTESGVFYPWFNQIRSDNDKGTKTGRFSSNFQQVPKEVEIKQVPFMRNYVLADSPNHVVIGRDFSQQELRVLAFFEHKDLFQAYINNPRIDIHGLVKQLILEKSGLDIPRWYVKTLNFLLVYGGGIPALMRKLGATRAECQEIYKAHGKALPGVRELMKDIEKHTKQGYPIYTAGGREYYAEHGFEFRMLNTEIQSSSADHTKRSMIRIHEAFKELDETRIMITVHDEFLSSTPNKLHKRSMKIFKEAMEDDDLFNPMPMISDGKMGVSWGSSKAYKD